MEKPDIVATKSLLIPSGSGDVIFSEGHFDLIMDQMVRNIPTCSNEMYSFLWGKQLIMQSTMIYMMAWYSLPINGLKSVVQRQKPREAARHVRGGSSV